MEIGELTTHLNQFCNSPNNGIRWYSKSLANELKHNKETSITDVNGYRRNENGLGWGKKKEWADYGGALIEVNWTKVKRARLEISGFETATALKLRKYSELSIIEYKYGSNDSDV